MATTGHKSEASIRSYAKKKRCEMSDSLASKLFDIQPKRRKETGPTAVNSPQKDKLHPVGNKVDQQDPTIQTFEFAPDFKNEDFIQVLT